jgi:hypothetical protein
MFLAQHDTCGLRASLRAAASRAVGEAVASVLSFFQVLLLVKDFPYSVIYMVHDAEVIALSRLANFACGRSLHTQLSTRWQSSCGQEEHVAFVETGARRQRARDRERASPRDADRLRRRVERGWEAPTL